MNAFSQRSLEVLKSYVYVLRDPTDSKVFYVGKGSANRIFMHTAIAPEEREKVQKIRSIEQQGLEVIREIIHFGMTDEEAIQAEASLISYIGIINLTNAQVGHGAAGTRSVQEFEKEFAAEPVEVKHKVLVCKINRLWHREVGNQELYDHVRGYWRLSKERSGRVEYVFGVYKGLVKAIFIPRQWFTVGYSNPLIQPPRESELQHSRHIGKTYFIGSDAEDHIKSMYLDKDINAYVKDTQSPVRYINV